MANRVVIRNLLKRKVLGSNYAANCKLTASLVTALICITIFSWILTILLLSGDIHPNPGPASLSSLTSGSESSAASFLPMNFTNLSNHLSFVHYNVQSLAPKLDILGPELFEFDILAFSETWLKPSISSDDLHLHSFRKPERKDRTGDSHGGVIIYVKEDIYYKRRLDLEPRGTECIWIELILKNKHILFGLFYRPPNSDAIYFSTVEDSFHLAVDTGMKDIIITGDFNFNMLSEQSSRKIKDLCRQFSLSQIISQPTHFTENSSSLIDLLLVNDNNHVITSGVGDPFLQQDLRYHCPVFGVFNFSKLKRKSYVRQIWKYDQGNYELMKYTASVTDWDSLQHSDINIYAKNLTDCISSITESCIPNKKVIIRPSDPPWITTAIKRQIRKRKRAYRKAKQTNLQNHWDKFKRLRNKVVSMIRESKKSYFVSLSNKLKSDSLSSKQWWTILKSFIAPNSKTSIPPLEKDGVIYSDDSAKANVLNDFFRDQTILNDKNTILPDLIPYTVENSLNSLTFTPDEVESILNALPLGKAAGPDGINNRILRELSKELAPPICSFFNQSLRNGEVPECFKASRVCPVYKGGDPSVVSNYRPISLLSNLDKALERLVFKYIYNHFRDNNILTSFQSGFIPGDSTVNQLTYLYNTFCQALDSGKEVRVVFCDISKAFDRVWHAGLIHKLKAAGISSDLLSWFVSYLANRKQRVVLPGTESNWNFIHAGVPQGSILGPLLFLLYINDIVTDIGSNIRLFADDTSIYIIVDNPNTAAEILNTDLEKISQWAKTWLVNFNATKTEALLISRKTNKPVHPKIFMLGQEINEVQFHKHLGVYFSYDCSWHKQIEYIKEKSWIRINIMRKLKYELDRKSLETIYMTFIRPILEYADVLWDNCTQQEKQDLEKIQLEAARIATGTTKLISIQNLYDETGWEQLETRRKNHKLLLFYKMLNNISPVYLSTLVPAQVQAVSSYGLRNATDIRTINAHTSQYFNSFLPSVIRDWNSLPNDDKNVDTTDSFKKRLSQSRVAVPNYFYTGARKPQTLHTRLRTKCSSLNYDLFLKNIIDSPLCGCGSGEIENAEHFFLRCRLYGEFRADLLETVSQYCAISLPVLLNGEETLSLDSNIAIFEAVQKFILLSKRF